VPLIVEKLLFNGHFIRKCGHVGEYFILGILVFSLIKKLEVKKSAVVASFICFFYAITDELHQIFVPGRGPAVSDVLLDFVSSIAGILIANLLFFRKKVKK
jgi:VanZ family protein